MREKFEGLPEIKTILIMFYFSQEDNKYKATQHWYLNKVDFINGAWYAFQEQQKKIDLFNKMILSLRNEFNLWADDTESFNAIEAQIENLEEILK